MNKDDCIFCKIARGVFDSKKIYEDNYCVAILDKFPATYGHALVIPKEHYENVFEIPVEIASHLYIVATNIAKAAHKALEKHDMTGMNILQNNGKMAGQSVFHFHIHVIPRYESDNLIITFDSKEASEESLTNLLSNIKAEL